MVEFGDQRHRISRTSVAFFEAWVDERLERVRKNVKDPLQRQEVLRPHETAREFWRHRQQMANVD